ncbi:elongation factor Tu domain protein [Medicago truncatula]|uniref:Elongation factor Tu domain protein n=2 Tax=Medicago truncatula TaxID=3880 RepID=G7II13_MEDTR|nr:elongation factor Tu domain protein [Medicago truncatula]
MTKHDRKVALTGSFNGLFVAFTFELDKEPWHETFTFLRIYEGVLQEGDTIVNVNTDKRNKVDLLFFIRHTQHVLFAPKFHKIKMAYAGQLVVVMDVNFESPFSGSGDTLTDDSIQYVMSRRDLPKPTKEYLEDDNFVFKPCLCKEVKQDKRELVKSIH